MHAILVSAKTANVYTAEIIYSLHNTIYIYGTTQIPNIFILSSAYHLTDTYQIDCINCELSESIIVRMSSKTEWATQYRPIGSVSTSESLDVWSQPERGMQSFIMLLLVKRRRCLMPLYLVLSSFIYNLTQ